MDTILSNFPGNIEIVNNNVSFISQDQIDNRTLDSYSKGSITNYNNKYYCLSNDVFNPKEWNAALGATELWVAIK